MMQRKSEIGHTGLPFNCPHTEDLANEVISMLDLSSQSQVLDLGCGKAELLNRIVEKYSCTGIGIDINSNMFINSRKPTQGAVDLVEGDITEFVDKNDSVFETILCIGSLPEGKQEEFIRKLSRFLSKKPDTNSYFLLGELVWVKPPDSLFLDHLQMKESDYCTLDRLIAICAEIGLEVVLSTSQSLEEYETSILDNVEAWAACLENHADPDYDEIVARSRDWNTFSKEHAWGTWEFATLLVRVST